MIYSQMRWRYFSAKPLDKRELHRNRLKVSRAAACLLRITLPGPSNQSIRPTSCVQCRAEPTSPTPHECGFFIFLFFNFIFYKNIFLFSKFTGIYPGRPAAERPGPGRPAAERQGLLCKFFCENICAQVSGGRSPGSGAAGPPGRPTAGRLAPERC